MNPRSQDFYNITKILHSSFNIFQIPKIEHTSSDMVDSDHFMRKKNLGYEGIPVTSSTPILEKSLKPTCREYPLQHIRGRLLLTMSYCVNTLYNQLSIVDQSFRLLRYHRYG